MVLHRRVKVLLAGLLFCSSLFAESEWDSVEITSQHLRNGIYMLLGQGGNMAVSIGEDGTFLLDDQFAPLTDKIITEIEALGGQAPKFLMNTHWHFDHTGGNENLGKRGSVIIAHHNVRERKSVENRLEAFNKTVQASPKVALPVVTFGDDLQLHFNGDRIEALHLANAHTDGDSVIHFHQANIIHTGDIWFNGFYPFIDVEHGGSLEGMVSATTAIIQLARDDTLIIPGHGPVGDKAALIEYRDMLATVLDRLRKLKNQGLLKEKAVALKPTADLDAKWGGGFLAPDVWVGIVYSGLEIPDE